ncbi:MAG: nucleotidyltransferase domain-containing protein [Nanoarchaeota archaeon]
MATKIKKSEISELTECELEILKSFYPESKDLTLKELQKRTKYSYERINSYLKSLTNKEAVTEKKVGKTLIYSLDLTNLTSKSAYYIYAIGKAKDFSIKEKNLFLALSELPEEYVNFCSIFGSYAKGTAKKESDVDVLIVSEYKEKIEEVIASIKRKYGFDIQAIIIPSKEFTKIRLENKEFWNDLVKYGIIFKGYELLYYYAYGKKE